MTQRGRTIVCIECSTVTDMHSRRLCRLCYKRRLRDGDLIDIPRVTRPYADTIEDLEFFRDNGIGVAEAMRRLGMSRGSLWSVCRRNDRLDLWKAIA